MRKVLLILFMAVIAAHSSAQELYVFTEPASNMPARTITPKMKIVGGTVANGSWLQRYAPEIMFGISPKLMVHLGSSFSNMRTGSLQWEGAFTYIKYRFFSVDELHRHFRLAAFAEAGYSDNPVLFNEVSVAGENSGASAGLIATQLLNRTAVSVTTAYTGIFKKEADKIVPTTSAALNYSLSVGQLIFPMEYRDYDQLNLNLYAELLGQRTFGLSSNFIDLAPAIQALFNSNSKLSLGYRFQLSGNSTRSLTRGFLLTFEHTFFNAWKRKKSVRAEGKT